MIIIHGREERHEIRKRHRGRNGLLVSWAMAIQALTLFLFFRVKLQCFRHASVYKIYFTIKQKYVLSEFNGI